MSMRHNQALRRKTSLRLLIGGLAALVAGPAIAQTCLQPAERTAFDVRALQSKLMVAALSCSQDAAYNAFVRKFQGELTGAYRGVQGHFRRTAGGAHQRELDGFVSASLLRGVSGKVVANHAVWRSREDWKAMTRHPAVAAAMDPIMAVATFEPNLYEPGEVIEG
jgi:heme-degrading monooxygenase HmoA